MFPYRFDDPYRVCRFPYRLGVPYKINVPL